MRNSFHAQTSQLPVGNLLADFAAAFRLEVMHTWHYGINEGKAPAEILVFYAGVQGRPITVIEPR